MLAISIFSKSEKEKYRQNLDEFDIEDIDWMSIKYLLQLEGIDKTKLLNMSLNYFESVFRGKRQLATVTYFLSGFAIDGKEELNNAKEITEIVNDFLSSEEISEDKKIVLRGIIIRNFNNIINNSYYTMDTLENLISLGVPKEEVLLNKNEILHNIDRKNVADFNFFCAENGQPIDLTLDELVEMMFYDNEMIIPKEPEKMSEKSRNDFEIAIFTIKKVIAELLEKQGLDITSISYLGSGAYSDTIKVGQYVIKLGRRRENRGVPYSKHIIRPLMSFGLKMGVNIEVQNLVDAEWWKIKDSEGNVVRELSEEEIEEELFKVYANLRKDGIAWKDIKKENVGRLLKRNTSNLNIEYLDKNNERFDEEYDQSDDRLEIVGRKEGENDVLPAGELVIIDRDYLVGRGAWTPKNATQEIGNRFGKRYESMEK